MRSPLNRTITCVPHLLLTFRNPNNDSYAKVETQFYPDSTPAEETASDGNERVFQTIGSILQIASSALLFTGNFELANTVYGIHGILTAVVSLSDEGGSALEEYKSISKDLAKLPQKFKDTLKEEKIREHASALQTIHDSLADHTTILKSQRPEDSVVLDVSYETWIAVIFQLSNTV
jgi:hypothetical protein